MFLKSRNQMMLRQEGGGGGQSGDQGQQQAQGSQQGQQQAQQGQQQQTQGQQQAQQGQQQAQQAQDQQTVLPKELASLGFKDAAHVLNYLAEVTDDAKKSKTMFQELSTRIAGGGQQQQDDLTEDVFIKEPKRATETLVDRRMDQHFRQRIAPLATQLVEGNVAIQLMELKGDPEFGQFLDDLRPELTEFLKTVPPDVKVQPGAVRKAMQLVVGQNFGKVAKKWSEAQARLGAGGAGGSGDSSGAGGGGSASVGGKFSQLPEPEQEAARRQIRAGMFKDEAEYLQWKNEDYEGGD